MSEKPAEMAVERFGGPIPHGRASKPASGDPVPPFDASSATVTPAGVYLMAAQAADDRSEHVVAAELVDDPAFRVAIEVAYRAGREGAARDIEDAYDGAKSYHHRAALRKAVRIARGQIAARNRPARRYPVQADAEETDG